MVRRVLSSIARVKSFVSHLEMAASASVGYGKMHHAMFKDFSERSLLLQGRALAQPSKNLTNVQNLGEVEYRVFSQWGEAGIIECLFERSLMPNTRFFESEFENICEPNCRFTRQNRVWPS